VKDQQTVLKGNTHLDTLRVQATSSCRPQYSPQEPPSSFRSCTRDGHNTKQSMRCGKPTHPHVKCQCNMLQRILWFTVFIKDHVCYPKMTWLSNKTLLSVKEQWPWRYQNKRHPDLLNSTLIHMKIDTGAEVTAISEKVYQNLQQPTLQKPVKLLHGPGQHPLPVVGHYTTPASYNCFTPGNTTRLHLHSHGTKLLSICVPRPWKSEWTTQSRTCPKYSKSHPIAK